MGSLKANWAGQWKNGAAGAFVAVVLGWLFFVFPIGGKLKHLSYELPFLFRSDVETAGVVILYMDDESHEKLGQKYDGPWDRSLHARLIERLGALTESI